MAFFVHGQHRHYYYDSGSGSPVLLLHGLGNSGRAWIPQVSALLALGHRVIVPDLLGHGASSDAPDGITPHLQALEMLALQEHLGLDSIQLIGLSLGGMVALEMACHTPEAVEKLIVAGTFASMSSSHRQRLLSEWATTLELHNGCLKHFKSSWPALVGADFSASPRGQRLYQAWHAQAALLKAHNQIRWCKGMKQYDLSAKLQQIQAPTLVLATERDAISPWSEAEDIYTNIECARLVTIAGEGHVFNVPHAHAFNEATSAFLQEPANHA
ncbi:alpha/beta fold hydrolase [Pseudomonas sp. Hg5Tf]|uniref:Alpha/beta hydrolase n=1 Tax=Pseudomonas sp. Hg7Tf TaxID=3236988 RepID=A0AB39I9W1_9PSED|nr:alpha/beta hydrolase [Pseudomonas sp. Hg5Tf]MDH2562199.1 alpha/beta hydrolase [Pseudomonas sp. Hg5Tf]